MPSLSIQTAGALDGKLSNVENSLHVMHEAPRPRFWLLESSCSRVRSGLNTSSSGRVNLHGECMQPFSLPSWQACPWLDGGFAIQTRGRGSSHLQVCDPDFLQMISVKAVEEMLLQRPSRLRSVRSDCARAPHRRALVGYGCLEAWRSPTRNESGRRPSTLHDHLGRRGMGREF